jgi:hypothetical protein
MAKTSPLRFDVTSRTQNGSTVYEAVASIPGFRPVAVEKIEDGTTKFNTRSAITYVCKNRAAALGMTALIRYSATTPAVTAATTTTGNSVRKANTRTPASVAKR